MKQILLLLSCTVWILGAYAQDNCADAVTVTEGLYTVDAVDGTELPAQNCGGLGDASNAEWYTYTPDADYGLTVTTSLDQNAGGDTRFHVYDGNCGSLSCVGGDDDDGAGYLSIATMNVYAGVQYFIVFDDYWSDAGFDFELIESDPIEVLVDFVAMGIDTDGFADCVVDMNGDYLDDVVTAGNSSMRINYQQENGSYEYVDFSYPPVENNASWSIAAGDIDGNGYNDLLYAGGGGVSFMRANDDGTVYTETAGPEYVFCQRSNFVDINMDGHLDAFVCHDVAPNVYYINDGNGNYTFNQGGLGDTSDGGNYGSVWIDYDGDCDIDLFIAKCRGGDSPANINQMHRNNGDGTFTDVSEEVGLYDNVQTWSSAWGDFDNDGDMDVLVGASSFTNGGHKLMNNNGDGTFVDVTVGSGWDLFNGTGIEHAPGDFNNDGYVDVFASGSTIMLNNGDMTFTQTSVNPSSGAFGDLNNDGFLDVLNGGTAWMNQGNNHNWIKMTMEGTSSNKNGIGARVKIVSEMGEQIRDVRSGEGFGYMSSLNVHFGIADDTAVERIEVCWPSGITDVIDNPEINDTYHVVEGENAVSVAELPRPVLSIFPNPARDLVQIGLPGGVRNAIVTVYDMQGKIVMDQTMTNNVLSISNLNEGIYLIRLVKEGEIYEERFIKQ